MLDYELEDKGIAYEILCVVFQHPATFLFFFLPARGEEDIEDGL